jgi:alpha-D-ribose 1-methylphosphonate 5-triphosphate diphosphatase PhnM
MNTFVITGARLVTPNEVVDNSFLYVKKGIIEAIDVISCQRLHRSLDRIDGCGMWLLPGIVNISDTSLEKEMNESDIPFGTAFISVEDRLASCGITTVNHIFSLSFDRISVPFSEIKRLRRSSVIRHNFYTLPAGMNLSHGFGSGIKTGTAEILHADIHPLSILCSIFSLAGSKSIGMPESVKLATLNPAGVLGIDRKLGSLETGKIADIILVKEVEGIIMVEKVFVDGCKVFEKRA